MKTRSVILLFLSLFIIGAFVSCGGGGGGTSGDNLPTESVSELFPDVDEEALIANPPADKIQTVSNNAEIHTTLTKGDKVEITSSMIADPVVQGNSILVAPVSGVDTASVGQPLFVDNVFKGMVASVRTSGDNLEVGLKDAEKLSDVYDSFDVMFKNDAIKTALQRSLSYHKIKGRFDHLNAEPLEISVIEKPTSNTRGMTSSEVILRIDIPEGYYVPVKPQLRGCNFLNGDCSITVDRNMSKNIDLDKEYSRYGIKWKN